MVTVVFGARGKVGRHVLAGLQAAGEEVRATSRDPETAGFPPGTPVVAADLERPDTLPAALEGADRAFIYAKPGGAQGFADAAEAAGVRHVVLLSSVAVVIPGMADGPLAQAHRTVELALERSGLTWTFIRAGMFATNTLWWWSAVIRAGHPVRLPNPESSTAPVHEKDLAALAVTALTKPGHERRAYTVYGPQAITLREQVGHIGDAIGRPIPVEVVTVEEARAELSRTMPSDGVETILGAWTAGTVRPPSTSTVVEEVTGRPARTFAEWAVDHAADFR